jgi:hypothetical protein
MSKPSHSFLHDRIAAVERRLERRRSRLIDEASETTHAASQAATKVVPVAAAVGAGLLAMYLMRRRAAPPPPPSYSAYRNFREHYADPPRRGLRWAQLLGLVGTAYRVGTSPQLRAFWHGFQRARQRRAH